MKQIRCITVLVSSCFALATAQAGMILQPMSATSSAGELVVPGVPSNSEFLADLINQSGLSANYTSGVTDFDSFTASTTSAPRFGWAADRPTSPPATLDFDLGQDFVIDAMALWGVDGIAAIRDFTLTASSQSDFSNATFLGSYTALTQSAPNPAQVFTFNATNARYVRLTYTSNYGSTTRAGAASEIAFRGSLIPEPAAVIMGALGLVSLSVFRRTR